MGVSAVWTNVDEVEWLAVAVTRGGNKWTSSRPVTTHNRLWWASKNVLERLPGWQVDTEREASGRGGGGRCQGDVGLQVIRWLCSIRLAAGCQGKQAACQGQAAHQAISTSPARTK